MAAAAAGATYGAPMPFPVYHPGAAAAYYAHASMAAVSALLLLLCSPEPNWGKLGSDLWGFGLNLLQGVPYPTTEAAAAAAAAAAAEGKGKGKDGGTSPEKGSSGAPSGEDASRRYQLSLLQGPSDLISFLFRLLVLFELSLNFVACAVVTAAAMSPQIPETMTLTIRYQATCCTQGTIL